MLKRAVLHGLLLVAGTAGGLAILELGARAFSALAFPKMMVLDDELGWKHAHGCSKAYRDEFGADTVMTFDRDGLRGRERAATKRAGVRRVLVLGDSFTEGTLISDDDVFTARLEAALPNTEVLNAGVGAYGTVQEYLYLRESGLRYEPDLVMLMFYDNDLLDNFVPYYLGFGPRPYATFDAGHLRIVRELDPTKFLKFTLPIPFRFALSRHSYAYYFLNQQYHRRWATEMRAWERADASVIDVPTQFQIFYALVDEMKDLLDPRGIDFVVVLIPTVGEVAAGRSRTAETIVEHCRERGIACLPLIERLRGEQPAGEPLYYPVDFHWTKEGHRVAADEIGRFLVDRARGGDASVR